ncbi:MAG TPA: T9SS type A sorting domain-containing protein, partial [Candidatus Cloacimonadota bacterium]|nr:T9SS type A sorting domain-containing protein [Candidatus Cloacimonadota bacterium]
IVCSSYDAVGNLWLAANGLGRYDGTSWSAYRSSNSGLPTNQCYNVFIDSSGLVWVSTDSSGMNVFNYPASVANADPVVPVINTLKAWPNPFRQDISIEMELTRSSAQEISVYNLRGQKVRGLAMSISNDSKGLASWDGRDNDGADCPAGIYLIRAGRGAGARAVKVLKL